MRDDKKAREYGQEPQARTTMVNNDDYGEPFNPQTRAHEVKLDCKGKNVNIR